MLGTGRSGAAPSDGVGAERYLGVAGTARARAVERNPSPRAAQEGAAEGWVIAVVGELDLVDVRFAVVTRGRADRRH